MKWIFVFVLSVVCSLSTFAQLTQDELNDKFGAIRAEMVMFACKVADYKNDTTLAKIQNQNIFAFYNDLESQSAKDKKIATLKTLIGNANTGITLNGTNINAYKSRITQFKDGIVKGLLSNYNKKKDEINTADTDFSNKINKLVVDCEQKAKNAADAKAKDAKIAELQNEIDKLKKQNNPNIVLYIIIVALIITSLIVLLIKKKKKSKKKGNIEIQQPTTPPIKDVSQLPQSKPEVQKEPTLPKSPQPTPQLSPEANTEPESSSKFPVPPAITTFAIDANKWIVVGASVIGNGHISAKLPCQDSHKYESLGESWGIAIVSDGAGSSEYSHVGSRIVAERGIVHFKALIEKEGWLKNNELPSDAKWLQTSYSTLKAIRNDMEAFAKAQNISLKSLYATVIVVIHTPEGILATHIGDGRAGYKNQKDEWKALITPHKGEEANQTIFLPSDFWHFPNYVMSGVLVPESVVIRERPFAFTLMSDGCESSAWQYYTKNEKTGKFYDPNEPHPAFFDSLSETLYSFHKDKIALKEQEKKWANFISEGNVSLKNEPDDKTMILGVLYQ